MQFKLLTYNLHYARALLEVPGIVQSHQPDVITLQEINTLDIKRTQEYLRKIGFELSHYSHTIATRNTIIGVATFYNPAVFTLEDHHIIYLPKGWFELIDFFFRRGIRERTVLKTILITKDKRRLAIYNVHLSPYAKNNLRLKQIEHVFGTLESDSSPTILVGDFNYPYGRKKLENIFHAYGFEEGTSTILSTFKGFMRIWPFSLKLDYILHKGFKSVQTEKIPLRASDHFPLIATCALDAKVTTPPEK